MGRLRVCCYLRRSVEEADGLLGQRAYLEQVVKEHPLWEVVGWFVDDGASGYGFGRPGFLALEQRVEEKGTEVVLVKDFSRLGRNYKEVGALLKRWEKQGIRLLAPADGVDTAESRWKEQFLALALKTMGDECYLWDISQKEKAARRAMMLRGQFAGGHPPYGFRKKEKQLVKEEKEWAVVQQIFFWHQKGYGKAAIARRLNILGVPAPGKKGWKRQTVRYLLQNEIYQGVLVQGKRQRLEPKGRRHWTKAEQWICTKWQKEGEEDAVCSRVLPDFGGEGRQCGKPEDVGGRSGEKG